MDMNGLWQPVAGHRRRESSYDVTGGNADCWRYEPGQRRAILDVTGRAGCVQRFWMTVIPGEGSYLQTTRVRCEFDGHVTVEDVPLGMLFATGSWRVNDVNSAAVNVMRARVKNTDQEGIGRGSFNLHWPMPFERSAKIELFNDSPELISAFHYVDWLEDESVHSPLLFSAAHNTALPMHPAGPEDPEWIAKNLSDAGNFPLAEITGQGRYVGTVLAVESLPDRQGKWYEGDDMFFIDGEPWPPSLHGTGTEDYFGMAWGIHRPWQAFDHGVTHYERDLSDHDRFWDGRFVLYRWHVGDGIVFRESLRASIEAGHANEAGQHYESLAIWYGGAND